ncbi:TetR/AcrR family transcriptional regulator [Kocuria sp. JC486]|uniref:TetR/AcrR family transcriptional regulator n=1 Tax=Kocuria sp. JC486 TaxID=1970736 RepID=UPI001422F5F9|nr:TetR/AcrR family transcriptional regulator [Kocuria sp. JC486]NHU85452.1 TetR/AcrR family transcriptional regulator [Kocuria sp. JC486]
MELSPRQAQVFAELRAIFLTEGFAHFTVDGAATRLQCSKSTLYALGRTREELIRAVLVDFFKGVAAATDAALTREAPVSHRLLGYLDTVAVELEPASAQFMRDVATSPAASEVYATNTRVATTKLTDLIDQGIANGEFRPAPTDLVADIIATAMDRLQQRTMQHGAGDSTSYRALGELIVHGMASGHRQGQSRGQSGE